MPQDPNNLQNLANMAFAPIQPSVPAYQPAPAATGWESPIAGIANLASQFLGGVSKGRAQAYDRSLQEQQKQVASLQTALQAIATSGASDEVKQKQSAQVLETMGRMIQGSLPDSKGKKDGQQGHPMIAAMGAALDSMLGPKPKKDFLTPEAINATLGSVFSSINDPNNSAQAFTKRIEDPVMQAHSALAQKLGHPPTFAEIEADEATKTALSHNAAANGGQFTQGAASIIQSAQAVEKEQQALAVQKLKDDELQKREDERQTRSDDRLTKTLDARQGKYSGELGQRAEAEKILADPKATATDKKAATDTLRSLTDKQRRTEGLIRNATDKQSSKAAEKNGVATMSYVVGGPSIMNPKGDTTVDTMAWEFINTGHVPFTGMGSGKGGDNKRERAIGRAGEILADLGMSPKELTALRGRVKSESGALAKITTMGALVGQFESTLEKNLKVAEDLDAVYKRGDTTFINAIKRAYETGTGETEALNLAAQLHGVSREWAKIMAGSTSAAGVPISEAKDADSLMSASMSSGQIKSLFDNVIRKDATNRMEAINEQKQSILQQLQNPTDIGGTQTKQPQTASAAPAQAVDPKYHDLLQSVGIPVPAAPQQNKPSKTAAPPSPPATGKKDPKATLDFIDNLH